MSFFIKVNDMKFFLPGRKQAFLRGNIFLGVRSAAKIFYVPPNLAGT